MRPLLAPATSRLQSLEPARQFQAAVGALVVVQFAPKLVEVAMPPPLAAAASFNPLAEATSADQLPPEPVLPHELPPVDEV